MKYRFFHIPARFPAEGESELNAFCAGHQVVTVEKSFVADGQNSYWSFCVTWRDSRNASATASPKSKVNVAWAECAKPRAGLCETVRIACLEESLGAECPGFRTLNPGYIGMQRHG